MTLELSLSHQFETFSLQVDIQASPGITALFGRSGAGKTTVAQAVSGLLTPQQGRITLAGSVLFDRNLGINIAPNKRRIGYVFQDGRLFPHMSVAGNLRFGKQFATTPLDPKNEQRIIDMLGLGHMLARRPGTLSGGEKQRVAIGRALLSDPRMLIMDEPLAALDTGRKAEILPYLERLRDEAALPILYISHAMDEIARLADTLVLLQAGRVMRAGPAVDILADPAAVPFIGVRHAGAVLMATVMAHHTDGLCQLSVSGGMLHLPGVTAPVGEQLRLRVLAQDIILATARPQHLSALNILPAVVTSLRFGDGPGVAVGLRVGQEQLLARITKRSANELDLSEGRQCFAILKATTVSRDSIGQ